MTDKQTPADWVLIEAAKRSGGYPANFSIDKLRYERSAVGSFRALCDMIAKYETEPVDRKLLCAREAMAEYPMHESLQDQYRSGGCDNALKHVIRAIELWESGYGQ